jgi:uncharacterized protein (DUF1501 family)
MALAGSLERFGLINSLAQAVPATDYKALVCIFLEGGNDGNNMVIPYDDYNTPGGYNSVRGSSVLAVPQSALLQVSPPSQAGHKFGFHSSMTEVQALFTQQKLAVLCNVGSLIQPITRAQYQSDVTTHPYQLFSHPDQRNSQQSSVAESSSQIGWGGRTADALVGINGSAPLPMVVSVAGSSVFATGINTRQLALPPAPASLSTIFFIDYVFISDPEELTRLDALHRLSADPGEGRLAKAYADELDQGFQTGQVLSTDPALQTSFPNTSIGSQLKQIAKLISIRSTLGMNRQIFFCLLSGFDTHNNQRGGAGTTQDGLLQQLSAGMKAFYDSTVSLGVGSQVTTFTLSDFGRTFEPAGTGIGAGTDHAWGNHQLIMGGAVQGGDFYGTYPTLAMGGPDDADSRGRWIPTTSIDQYAATLARWYGLPEQNIPLVFPSIGRFASSNLGFL